MKKKPGDGEGRRLVGGGGAAGGRLDRQLIPRIEQYALNNNYTDVDDVSDYLRRTYKEYHRRQKGTFRTMVTRAINVIQWKGGVQKPELQLQAHHLAGRSGLAGGRAGGSSSDGSSGGGSSSDDEGGSSSDDGATGSEQQQQQQWRSGGGTGADVGNDTRRGGDDGGERRASGSESKSDSQSRTGSGSSGSDPELDPGHAAELETTTAGAPASHMNNSLLNMYARSATPLGVTTMVVAGNMLPQQQAQPHSVAPASPPAFAPRETVAAAATRALARAKAEREGKKAKAGGGVGGGKAGGLGDASAPSTSGRSQGAATGAANVVVPRPALMLTAAEPQQPPAAAAGGSIAAPAAMPAASAGVGSGGGGGGGMKRQRVEGGGSGEAAVDNDTAAALTAPMPKPAAKRARRLTGGGGGGRGLSRMGGGGSSAVTTAKPVTYADLGGVEEVLSDIRELIEYPLKHPEVYAWLGVEPPRGVLLHGPPGCGKTALANAIANECGVPFLRVSAPEIVSGMSGESEAKLRQLFSEARDMAPCIVFIDEIDAICPKRETAQREMERRIVAQMLTCMDDLSSPVAPVMPVSAESDGGGGVDGPRPPPHVVVIGATNRPDALDPALRRAGRFDREISLGIPTEAARVKILQVISRRLRLEGNFDFRAVAKRTPGFVGADLAALTKEAAAVAVTRIFVRLNAVAAAAATAAVLVDVAGAANGGAVEDAAEVAAAAAVAGGAGGGSVELGVPAAEVIAVMGAAAIVPASLPGRFGGGPLRPSEMSGLAITMEDFEAALPKVQPSVRREGFTTTPDVCWDDVGALAEVRDELSFAITQPIRFPERFEALGLPAATGVLLYGPPGCGKTLVAKAVANESGANFISIKGPELLNKYVGESERAVRQLFTRARAANPCVLFFDEMDALAPRRGSDNNQAAERVVNQLLTEMDGMDSRQGLYIVAATNRPDMIDPALLRPGRLDKVLYVPLPPPQDREAILNALVRRTPLEPDVDLMVVAADRRCEGYSGADCAALVREAAVMALKEAMAAGPGAPSPRVGPRHFDLALNRVMPSVSRKDRRSYDALRLRLRSTRSRIQPDVAMDSKAVAEMVAAAAGGASKGDAAAANMYGMEGAVVASAPGADVGFWGGRAEAAAAATAMNEQREGVGTWVVVSGVSLAGVGTGGMDGPRVEEDVMETL